MTTLNQRFSLEWVRSRADERVVEGLDTELDFYAAARELGIDEAEADDIATHLNERVMRARGAI